MQRGVAKGLKVPCLFMITEVSIRCQKNPEVGIRRIPMYTPAIHHCLCSNMFITFCSTIKVKITTPQMRKGCLRIWEGD